MSPTLRSSSRFLRTASPEHTSSVKVPQTTTAYPSPSTIMNTSTRKSLKRKAASPTPSFSSSSSSSEAEDSPYALSTHMPWPSQLAGHKDELEEAERKVKKVKQDRTGRLDQQWSLQGYMNLLSQEKSSLASSPASSRGVTRSPSLS